MSTIQNLYFDIFSGKHFTHVEGKFKYIVHTNRIAFLKINKSKECQLWLMTNLPIQLMFQIILKYLNATLADDFLFKVKSESNKQ